MVQGHHLLAAKPNLERMIMSWAPLTLPIFVEIGQRWSVPCNIWNITLNCVISSLSVHLFLVLTYSKMGGRIFTIYTSNDVPSPKDVPFEGFNEKKTLFKVSKRHKTSQKVGLVRQFQAKRKKNWIFNIFETISQINTKFDRTLKTAKAPSRVISYKSAGQIQDGGRPLSWKISNGHISAMVHPIHFVFGSTVGFSESADRMALLLIKPNLRWRPAAILSKN